MSIQIFIPRHLRPHCGKQSVVEVNGQIFGDAMSDLVARHLDERKHSYSKDDKLRLFLKVSVNDRDTCHLNRETSPVSVAESVAHFSPVVGKC